VTALAFALPAAASANVPVTKISADPFQNTTSQHATEVEPDTFSNGNTIVSGFQVGRFFNGGASDIGWSRSTDGGATWSTPTVVAQDTSVQPVNPNTGQPLRTGFGLPFPAIDPRTGELYMAYEGSDFTDGQYNQIQLVHSTDRGRNWGAPVRVNGDPSVLAFTPSIAVTNDGDVGVTYYDLRTLRPGNTTTLPTSTWLTISPRGGRHFDTERQIAPVFDHNVAPDAGGLFLGDYQGLVTFGDRFRALFVTTNANQPNNRTDVHYGQFRSIEVDQRVAAVGVAGPRVAAPPASRAVPLNRQRRR
jgi:hypothetical protein